MLDLESVIIQTEKRFVQLACEGSDSFSMGNGTLFYAAYSVLQDFKLSKPAELLNLAEQALQLIRSAPDLWDRHHRDLMRIDDHALLWSSDHEGILLGWRVSLATAIAAAVKHTWPDLADQYPRHC